jgi:arylsulfatase A-like enzyme
MNTTARIGTTVAESVPATTTPTTPPDDAPNVLVVLLDDLGFAQLGSFGADIATPHIDRLAENGLRYNRFHVTALCSPTRASLLTGRNHHTVGMGFVPEVPTGFPGYSGMIPQSAATVARHLRDHGYNTMAVGKWHLTPSWELTASGPFDRWPLGQGFERFYGFLGADTNQWSPQLLVSDNHFVEPPTSPDDGYHLTEDLADRAIRMIRDQQQATPHRPFFCYFATGAMHAPHQVAEEWIAPYRGQFDDGWERWRERTFARQIELGIVPEDTTLTPLPSWVPDWDELSDDERRLYARMMEVYAGFCTHTDAQIGRLIDTLRTDGILDNTLVMVLSDNGASAEGGQIGSVNENRFAHAIPEDLAVNLARTEDLGGPRLYNHYAWGWAWAGNTPLHLWKRYTWLGGCRTPLVVHWPDRIDDPGAIRGQFAHVIDLMPTVLEATGIEPPPAIDGVTQQRIDGASLLPTIDDGAAPAPRTTQYFEMFGSRALFHDGWKVTTNHVGEQVIGERELIAGSHDFASDTWQLFDLDEDFAEAHDRSEAEPDRLAAMITRWWTEAGRNQVLPLDDTMHDRISVLTPSPNPVPARVVYRPGTSPVAEAAVPHIGQGVRLVADTELPDDPRGVIAAQGDWTSGWAWYLHEGRPRFAYNHLGEEVHTVTGDRLPAGPHTLEATISPVDGGYDISFSVDGAHGAGGGTIAATFPMKWQLGGSMLRVGHDAGFPVCDDYTLPSPFTGVLRSVTMEVLGRVPPVDTAAIIELARRAD